MKAFALTCALALMALPAAAEDSPPDLAQITAAYNAGDLEAARAGLAIMMDGTPAPVAVFRYGRMLREGLGGPPDPEAGVEYIRAAAESGHMGALTYLGRLAMSGDDQDPAAAFRYFNQAAALGHSEAKHLLGLMYLTGQGVPQDTDLAQTWLGAAANEGYGPAMYRLALLPGTSADDAQRWLEAAAASGVADAQFTVARTLQGSGGRITDVVALFTQAAQQGHVPAQRMLGTLYLTGQDGLEPDAQRAEAWLGQAVRGQDRTAALNLGLGYLSGSVLEPNPQQARNLLEVASDNGAPQASFALAQAFEAGTYTDAGTADAVSLYKLAVTQGSARAAARLGQMVLADMPEARAAPHDAAPWVIAQFTANDDADAFAWLDTQARDGVTPAQAALGAWLLADAARAPEAVPYLTAASRAGHVPSQFRLGRALTTGVAGEIDYVRAHTWLNIAATSGHESAAEMRDTITDLMTAADIATAQGNARTYFETARTNPPVGGVRMD
ncbi:tetratricopeptide repeat protein [Tateyamaria sp. SN6-1]|uniref:tetratricopeptide repeat protein n=1 Tax=Tateyamaria sp. SN6-1 TaxID=3092148 RepID=UPI0039F4FEFB